MGEGNKPIISRVAKFLPTVERPAYRESFNNRLKWTGVALVAYLVLSYISVYGVAPATYEQFRFLEIVLGSKFGSLMTLGIGPIVTAGIILQLLVGSKIIDWDMSKPEERKKFQTWNKLLSVLFCFLEAIVYVATGALPVQGGIGMSIFVMLQLAAGGIIVLLLDELVSKWGFGSGISLFIAAGISTQLVIRIFSPLTQTCKALHFSTCIPSKFSPPTGLLWRFLMNMLGGNVFDAFLAIFPLISTIVIFLVIVYAQDMSVNIPLAFSAIRGFGRTWGLKLFYTSNIPVIFAAALLANFQLMGRIGLSSTETGLECGMLGCYDKDGNAVSGLIFYLSTPTNFLVRFLTGVTTSAEIVRVFVHILLLVTLATLFSVFWVNTSGMDAKSVAEQIDSIGMQIPGYRKNPKVIESVLSRYIPSLAVLGGIAIGFLAAIANIIGAIGTGTGMLLTVMIVHQYYEQLSAENLEEAHPLVRRILGG